VNRFEVYIHTELKSLRENLKKRKLAPEEQIEIEDSIQHLNLPGLMAFLALGKKGKPRPKKLGTGQEGVQANLFEQGAWSEKAIGTLINKITKKRGVPHRVHVQKVRELLSTGEFFMDLASGTAAVISVVPKLPLTIVRDLRSAPKLPAVLISGLVQDLGDSVGSVEDFWDDLQDGEINSTPKVMTHTLRGLFRQSRSLKTLVETMRTLISPENETVRLAIIIYARSQGISIEDRDVDAVYQALDPTNPNLGPLLLDAFDYLERQHGVKSAKKILRRMGQRIA
jgi:hypothetical protein